MHVVVVESPAKAKTINKYLGSDYQVLASYGHVRDLPPKDGSVRPDEDFAMSWAVDAKSQKRINDIAKAVKGADALILATDPDREGEAISWHVLQALRDKKALKDQRIERVVFNAITKQAVTDAMRNPRAIDTPLVDAYLARRALDYLVGFTLSPVLWRKLPGARSAGRVQSVALRLVCDREAEIEAFVSQEYWTILAKLLTAGGEAFDARLTGLDGKKLDKLGIRTGDEAEAIRKFLDGAGYAVTSVEARPQKRNPQPPFTTSTLQQEASRKLGFSSARTMQIAQRLYEGIDIGGDTVGLITYMRTDAVQMSQEGIQSIRREIGSSYGDRYLPEKQRHYATKAKNAQEAHEAIRPTDVSRRPKDLARSLDADQAKLYELIWKRAVASQMESAEIERTTVEIAATGGGRSAELRATGQVIKFDGFLTLYQEGRDDEDDDGDGRLPPIESGEKPKKTAIETKQHFTEPPPRYTEATLIKKMEELGIGRPSTYASTMAVLRDRGYVVLDKRRLVPEDKGRLVTAFLESFFERYVEFDFTASLEEKLDKISNGDLAWQEVLREFWQEFSAHVDETKELRVADVLDSLNEILGDHIFPKRADGGDPRACPSCAEGRLSLKLGRYGAFIGCSNYPDCRFTRQLAQSNDEAEAESDGPKVLGTDPETGLEVSLRSGRFGTYLQLGEAGSDGEKPKRATLPKGWSPDQVGLEDALKLLALPREVGTDPETGNPITAGIGRYGPFVKLDKTYANLDSVEEVFSVGLNRAVSLIAEKREKGGKGRNAAAELKALGEHPTAGGPVSVKDGKYGPYVNHGKVNATLPKDKDPQSLTMEEAVALLEAKAGPAKKAGGTKSKAKASTSAKKGTTSSKSRSTKSAGKTAGKTTRARSAKTSND
ncbi:type I DNA topoisomerase [Amorphus orientalis]|uniref:DNA topoisomerase 1 n=1 Tax=Amorphus orientalis TaxID=649198 RepID=A0AAE4ATB2_9HYPH|nr:type I DNA topoisomerase [Amorphus orientalis]MDQ0317111.1 DNA topoisomerase-1 [Amorphus orientalis]